jgi:hypothetical protein
VQPLGNWRRGFRRTFIDPVEFCDRSQQLTLISERCDPEFFQVLVCQIRKGAKVDVILSEALSVLPETDRLKPVRDLLHRGSSDHSVKPMQTSVVRGWSCRYDLQTSKFDVPALFSDDNAKAVVPE